MALHSLFLFCLVYFLAVVTPGPGIAAIVARVLGRGSVGLAPFIAGYLVGDLTWFTLAATGMVMLAKSAHTLFLVIRYLGAAYLLYLGYRLWTAPNTVAEAGEAAPQERGAQLFLASLSLTLSNPKAMIFYLALLPTVIDLPNLTVSAFFELALALSIILCAVLLGYAIAALRARQLFRSSRALRWLNRCTGTVLAGAAVVVAAR